MVELVVEVESSAPPKRVWAALIDFAAYEQWRPFQSIEGEAKAAARIHVT